MRANFSYPRRLVLMLVLTLLGFSACDQPPKQTISLQNVRTLPAPEPTPSGKPLTLVVGSMITPEEGYGYYRQLIDYLAVGLDKKISVRDPGNYAEVNRLLENGEADIAFVCAGPYVDGQEHFGLQLVAAPQVKGEVAYYSNLIVPAVSAAQSLADLRGSNFAFADPLSNSGALVPKSKLMERGETPESFFNSLIYTYGHDRSIRAVADQLVDGAAVDSLIWDYLISNEPELKTRVRVIERFGPYGIPPVVISPKADNDILPRLRTLLTQMHQDPAGQKILAGMHIERFVMVDDAAYDSVRELQKRLNEQGSRR